MITVVEYARRAHISPRAVRAKAEKGLIQAHKLGNQWFIDETPRGESYKAGRPLSSQSFNDLALMLDGQAQGLSAQRRHRAKQRLALLHENGTAALKTFARRPDYTQHYLLLPVSEISDLHAELADNLTGVSHPAVNVHGAVVDAYVDAAQFEELKLFYSFQSATSTRHNVRLRVGPVPQPILTLHCAADLLEDDNPRSKTAAEEMLTQLLESTNG